MKFELEMLSGMVPYPTEFYYRMIEYDINTTDRAAMFLAQCAHESAKFTVTKENLNYSSDALRRVFRKYFPNVEIATTYARNPERIANRVYANRMGNGDEKSGDGWKFRGRGFIQLTGKNNYTAFAHSVDEKLDSIVEYLDTFDGCVESACWFWKTNNLNAKADIGDLEGCTRRINGGLNGFDDRLAWYKKYLQKFR